MAYLPPPETRLAIEVTSADGRKHRWAADQADPERVPIDLAFSTAIPGAFKDCGCTLRREFNDDPADLDRFDEVEVYGPGGETAWKGRSSEFPWQTGEDFGLDVNAVGLSAAMLDNPTFSEIYIDRDLSARWAAGTDYRQAVLMALNRPVQGGPEVAAQDAADLGNALSLAVQDTWASPLIPQAEAWYDAGAGRQVRRVLGSFAGYNNTSFILGFAASDDQLVEAAGTSPTQTGDIYTATSGSFDQTWGSGHRYMWAAWGFNATPGGTAGTVYLVRIGKLAVIGNHTLSLVGTAGSGTEGFSGPDVVRDLMNRMLPDVATDNIDDPSGFVIPHLVIDPCTPESALLQINGMFEYDWGIDEEGFFWRPPSSYRRRWLARKDEGAGLELAGLTSEDAVNGIIVTFTNEAGNSRTAGPIGSGCDYESALLSDDDPENPANSHGIVKYAELPASNQLTAAEAIQAGARRLAEILAAPARGSGSVKGWVRDADTRILFPAWAVRSGDSIRWEDLDNVERRIIGTNYTHDSLTNSLTLDNTPHALDVLLARAEAQLVGFG